MMIAEAFVSSAFDQYAVLNTDDVAPNLIKSETIVVTEIKATIKNIITVFMLLLIPYASVSFLSSADAVT